jgi:aminopeptidase YwaD
VRLAALALAAAAALADGTATRPAGTHAWESGTAATDTAQRVATRLATAGPRPAGSRAERRAHALVRHIFTRAGLRVHVQRFGVPGRGRSRNVIGAFDTAARCLRVVMAHADTTDRGPGANDNASGVGVLAAIAPRLAGLAPSCDVWLVATGAEERVYTGSPDHLGALALARRVRSRGRGRLRWALSLDEVGRGRDFWLRSPVARTRRRVEGELLAAARRAGAPVRWVRDQGSGNSDHREFGLLGMPAAKLGVGAAGESCRHEACDRASRLEPRALRRARRVVERAIRAR